MFESPSQILLKGVYCSLLLFAFEALTLTGSLTQYGYLAFLAAPLSVIYLLARNREGLSTVNAFPNAGRFIIPFLPFILAFSAVTLIYCNGDGDWVLDYPAIVGIILLCSVCFGAISLGKPVTKSLFVLACALGTSFYVLDIVCTSIQCNVGLWDSKNWVVPYSTTYGRCIMIPAGLAYLGYFLLPQEEKATRWFALIAGCAGFIAATGFIAVRAVIPAVGIAFLCGLYLIWQKKQRKLLWPLFGSMAAVVLILGLASPLPQKILLGLQESTSVIESGAAGKTVTSILDKGHTDGTQKEEALQKSLNNSMGGRFAIWELAKIQFQQSPWIGHGEGRPSAFINLKELFKFSTDYLVHFHSDYVHSAVVGGLLLLGGLLWTQLWLIWIARRDPLRLYLILSICTFGVFEIGFLEVTCFASFMGAWTILSAWNLKNSDENFLPAEQQIVS